VRITKRTKVRVPWLQLAREPFKYLDADTIPDGFEMLDPSRLTKVMIYQLWTHWRTRTKAKQPILIFIEARRQDLGSRAGTPAWSEPAIKKTVPYVDISDEDSNGADKGEGASGSTAQPPPPECPIPEEQSPAANNSDRRMFLYSLSPDSDYRTLIDGVLALPVLVSPFFFFYELI
jgi:hypothetical protein